MSAIARWLLGLFGWKVLHVPPQKPDKAVLIFYPHTSNWDFVIGILARSVLQLPAHFAAKDTVFRWPFGRLGRWLGGIPVNRREPAGLVAQLADEFKRHENFFLAITPEGTRRRTEHLKSGFYRVAMMAHVPLGCAFIDYPRREIGILDYRTLSGDASADLASIAELYAGHRGKHPAQEGRFVFSEKSALSLMTGK